MLEDEREDKLQTSFIRQTWTQVVNFIQNIIEKPLENKKNSDRRRLGNLLLDQMKKKATFDIEKKGTPVEQQHIYNLHEKFMRKLNLQLQLDKLEKRFVENMPPPSLNIFDKLELHAKELKIDNNHLKSLREQWKNTLRKTKLDLTNLMRQAKIIEIEELHPHFTRISFPPQANNKALIMNDTEARVLNLGPKFVPPAPQQVLERLSKEIEQMKDKVAEAWRGATKTIRRERPL
ncbi:unnamed protein product, partial [Rotaria sp. Silwood2]